MTPAVKGLLPSYERSYTWRAAISRRSRISCSDVLSVLVLRWGEGGGRGGGGEGRGVREGDLGERGFPPRL